MRYTLVTRRRHVLAENEALCGVFVGRIELERAHEDFDETDILACRRCVRTKLYLELKDLDRELEKRKKRRSA